MGNLGQDFDQEAGDDIVPNGTYVAMAVKSEVKPNKARAEGRASRGTVIEYEFKITEGEHSGRIWWQTFNWEHENQTAENIGKRELAQLRHACGKLSMRDSSELHGIPFRAVLIKEDGGQYRDKNKAKTFLPLSTAPPAAQGQGTAPPSQGDTGGQQSSGRPWDNP